jgi:hypothetical protein
LLFDRDAMRLRDHIASLLAAGDRLADVKPGDTGQGMGHADLWVTHAGVEFLISVRRCSEDEKPF